MRDRHTFDPKEQRYEESIRTNSLVGGSRLRSEATSTVGFRLKATAGKPIYVKDNALYEEKM